MLHASRRSGQAGLGGGVFAHVVLRKVGLLRVRQQLACHLEEALFFLAQVVLYLFGQLAGQWQPRGAGRVSGLQIFHQLINLVVL